MNHNNTSAGGALTLVDNNTFAVPKGLRIDFRRSGAYKAEVVPSALIRRGSERLDRPANRRNIGRP
jgi:hypothetical protein